ncbi:MAG: hypothetical protein K2O01_04595, partial [Bacteroidales bacterium]|nr:hypothetical protein [Bacteroidales bacterium]
DVLSKVGDRPYLELAADADNQRLLDTLGVTRKLNREGGEATDVVVGFIVAADRTELTTGSKLGVLFGLVKKWFSDLRALAFKDKVALTDLDADVKKELDGKVAQVKGMGLSEANFTSKEKLKLDGIKPNANNYSLPLAASDTRGGVKIGYSQSGRNYPVQLSDEKMYVNVPWTDTDTVYSHPTSAGNKHIPSGGSSGQYLKYYSSGTAQWVSPANNTATTSTSGFMSSSDKSKLDGINDSIKIAVIGSTIRISWTNPNTYPNPTACYADIKAM